MQTSQIRERLRVLRQVINIGSVAEFVGKARLFVGAARLSARMRRRLILRQGDTP
jgi:hypothetical protein